MRNAPQTVKWQIIMEERSLPRLSPCDTPITPDRSRVPMMKTFRMRERHVVGGKRKEKKRKRDRVALVSFGASADAMQGP